MFPLLSGRVNFAAQKQLGTAEWLHWVQRRNPFAKWWLSRWFCRVPLSKEKLFCYCGGLLDVAKSILTNSRRFIMRDLATDCIKVQLPTEMASVTSLALATPGARVCVPGWSGQGDLQVKYLSLAEWVSKTDCTLVLTSKKKKNPPHNNKTNHFLSKSLLLSLGYLTKKNN